MKMAQILKDKKGKPAFAILDYADYERLLATAEDAEDAQAVRAALADGGEVTPLELTERVGGNLLDDGGCFFAREGSRDGGRASTCRDCDDFNVALRR